MTLINLCVENFIYLIKERVYAQLKNAVNMEWAIELINSINGLRDCLLWLGFAYVVKHSSKVAYLPAMNSFR